VPNPADVKRIAEAMADYYNDHKGKPLKAFVDQYWDPGIVIRQSGRPPYGIAQFLKEHSPDTGMSWDDIHMHVEQLVVGEDAFVLHYVMTRWRTHEADEIEKSGAARKPGLEGYQTAAIPGITICTIGESGKVERMDGYVFMPPELVARGAIAY
jgi:ketosteroid isomerase-like protein